MPNIHRKTPVFNSHFNKVSGLQACSCIEKYYRHRCFPVSIATFLTAVFSIEYLLWLLSCRLGKEERKAWNKRARKGFRMKEENENISYSTSTWKFSAKYNRNANSTMTIPQTYTTNLFTLLLLLFVQISFFWFLWVHFLYFFFVWETEKYLMSYLFSIFRSKDWELLCKIAVCKM